MAIITLNNNSLSGVTALPAGLGGKVLQVVSDTISTYTTTTSTSEVDTGLQVDITPVGTSSKFVVLLSMPTSFKESDNRFYGYIKRNVDAGGWTNVFKYAHDLFYTASTNALYAPILGNIMDAPSASTSVSYKAVFYAYHSSNNIGVCLNDTTSSLTVLEIEN